MSTCGTCKHWRIERGSREELAKGDKSAYYPMSASCEVLIEIIDNDYLFHIELPYDFGCNKWEARPPEETATL